MADVVTLTLPLSAVRTDGDTQYRDSVDRTDLVDEYAEAYRAGVTLPPLEVVRERRGGAVVYWLWDGFQRLAAAAKAGRREVPVRVTEGTQADAQWFAFSANKAHGLRRTRAETRRCIEGALVARPHLSDRQIADHVGVHPETVARFRRASATRKAAPDADENVDAKRQGRDGKMYSPPHQAPRPPVGLFDDDWSPTQVPPGPPIPPPRTSANGPRSRAPASAPARVDCDGVPIPQRLWPVFDQIDQYREAHQRLTRAADALLALEDLKSYAAVKKGDAATWEFDPRTGQPKVWQRSSIVRWYAERCRLYAPVRVCRACRGAEASAENEPCGACEGKGWQCTGEVERK